MTTRADNDKRGGFSAWLFGSVFRSGWRRRIVLVVAVALFFLIVASINDDVDYQRDPSALVPRDAAAYFETRDLKVILKNAAMWPLWNEERRAAGDEQWNHIQAAAAGILRDNVHGFGSRLPLSWLESARRAALAIGTADPESPRAWTLLFEVPSPAKTLREIRQEPGLSVVKLNDNDNLAEVSGNDARSIYVGAVGPWLVVSSTPAPLLFAVDAVRKPALTLGAAGVLNEWRSDASLRGVFDPAAAVLASPNDHISRMAGWMRPEARVAVSSALDDSGLKLVRLEQTFLGAPPPGSWLWTIVKFILSIVALGCLLLAAAILLAMLGWAGWLKALAVKTGIQPADAPKAVEPSAAFREDAGFDPSAGPIDTLDLPGGAVPARSYGDAAVKSTDDASGESSEQVPVDTLDVPGGEMPLAEAEGEGLVDRGIVEESTSEPLETFPEMQNEDIVDEEAGHLAEERSAGRRTREVKSAPKTKTAVRKAPAKPKAKTPRKNGDGTAETAPEGEPAKPKRVRKKPEPPTAE